MRGSRGALIVGVAIAAVYLVGAVVSGRLSPLARRPLLDGFAPPPPYRWVRPPPSLAATNQQPSGGGFVIVLDPTAGSEAGVFSTDDSQASLALGEGAIPSKTGDSSVLLEITPLAPAGATTVPRGMQLTGNVYRISATSRPSGSSVGRFGESGQLVLAYPASADGQLYRQTLLRSEDGRSWTAIQSIDSIGQHLVQGNVREPGFFIVGQSRVGTPGRSSIRTTIYRVILFAGLTAIVVAIAVAELRSRRKTSRSPGQGRSRRRGRS